MVHKAFHFLSFDYRVVLSNGWEEFFFGMLEGYFKFQPRLTSTCYSDGINIAHGVRGILGRLHFGHAYFTDEELFGFQDAVIAFFRKCNYLDTLQVSIALNLITNWLNDLNSQWKKDL
jgi:hypothetical protein